MSSPLSAQTDSSPDVKRKVVCAVVLAAAVLVSYYPFLSCGFIWDDPQYVVQNMNLRDNAGLERIWLEPKSSPQYYPMVHTMFWLEYSFIGPSPFLYHLNNILLHLCGAFLLWAILAKVKLPGAFAAAIIFAIHPVQVESVAWITERKNILSGVFYLLSALMYLRFSPPDRIGPDWRNWPWLAAAVVAFVLALLSKSVTASLPAAIGLLLWWKRGRVSASEIAVLAGMLLIGVAAGLYTAHLEKVRVYAVGADWDITFIQRFTIAGMAVWFYAWKLLLPVDLTFIYPRWNPAELGGGHMLFSVALLVVIFAMFLARNRIGRGPLAAVLFFVGTIFPALGFFNVYPHRFSFVADHFQYLASIGIIVLVVGAIGGFVLRKGQKLLPYSSATLLVVLVAYAWQIWQLALQYENEDALWLATISKNDKCWLAYNNLGVTLAKKFDETGDPEYLDDARKMFAKTLALNPKYEVSNGNMGFCLLKQGRFLESQKYCLRAVELSPGYVDAWRALAVISSRLGNSAQYRDCIIQLARLRPNEPEYQNALRRTGVLTSSRPATESAPATK